jgi:hypothetical protein
MQSNFSLIIEADYPNHTAQLRLLDASDSDLHFHQVDFKTIPVSRQQGLFNLRDYLLHYIEEKRHAETLAEIGVCIAEDVLGEEIFLKLWNPDSPRSLRIQLPAASEEENLLAAALARVPWEIARPSADKPTLGERNLLVRVVHEMKEPSTQPILLGRDESLRVLFVFAEARGSRPLAMRLERRELLKMFEQRIYPHRRVEADFLTHGVTRERLEEQIADRGGYHIVHWSGHGHLNLLELARPDGASDRLTGKQLLDLFSRAGGFLPHLFFLSACHSGDILRVRNWKEFLAVAEGKEMGTKQHPSTEEKEIKLDAEPGYTGTAHALLQGGVSSVVAMRYAVGDEYARELAVEFYDALLADQKPKSAASALTMARRALLDPVRHNQSRYAACDHATPVLYGEESIGLSLPKGRSAGLDKCDPRLHQIAELTSHSHEHFVGRTWELAGMGAEFIASSRGEEVKPVAVITGLGGMGKTALVAEALSLWEKRFEWVLLYQAKPNALNFDATLSDIHMKLKGELGRYHEHMQKRPADAIYRAADAEFTGQARLDRLTRNLIRALKDEAILLVLDNFETNLKPNPEAGESQQWACKDPAWDRCLELFASELAGTPSRVFITSRRPIAALSGKGCHRMQLGPLPSGEAALYLREHQGLSKMVFSGDKSETALAMKLLTASRFHPLLMDRLARLATGGDALRPQLMQALQALEKRQDYSQLPDLFASKTGDQTELAYLNDALATSLDQLIKDASAEARRLLWMIALANDPVSLDLLRSVWSGESQQQQQLRQLKQMFDKLPEMPEELQQQLKALPQELRAMIDALPPQPDPSPLIGQLVAVGLATEERSGSQDHTPFYSCHELVRERVLAWMDAHENHRAGLTDNSIRLAYAERLQADFLALQHQNMSAALEAGSRALIYYVEAGAYDRLAGFAGYVVTSASDPRQLSDLLPHLEAAAESAPEGWQRWKCLCYLADALRRGGHPDESLIYYEQSALQARSAAQKGGEGERQAWSDLGWINGNWAIALRQVGDLGSSRQRHLDSSEAHKRAGSPSVSVIGRELEALRIDIHQGRIEEALPEVEKRLAQIEGWWKQHLSGQSVEDAPDAEYLARAITGALDIARAAHYAQEDWEAALTRIDAILEVKRTMNRPAEEIALTRMNRAVVLARVGRFDEAKSELEDCLQIFKDDPARRARVIGSLAELFYEQGDVGQAIRQERRALALFEQLPDPRDRAISHNNLAHYLYGSGEPSSIAEASRHRLAALIYRLVSGLGQNLQTSLHNYAIDFRQAADSGSELYVPGVEEVLAEPAFSPLAEWLDQRKIDLTELQAAVDELLEQARQAAREQSKSE